MAKRIAAPLLLKIVGGVLTLTSLFGVVAALTQ
jgi:hypothetical protein